MTMTRNSIVTTIQIRRGAKIALSISYDYTDSDTSMPNRLNLQSWTDQAIERWWSLLTPSQRSALPELKMNLKISASSPRNPE